MAFFINGINQYQNSGVDTTPVNVITEDSTAIQSGEKPVLSTGQVVSGEILENKNGEITLKLDNSSVLNAILDSSMEVEVGQKLLFQVGNNTERTELRPLYTNLNNSLAANAALNEAGLSKTAANLAMVSTMMDEGMPVNKQAITSMSYRVAANPTTDPATIVQLNKLGLEINELNINQLENYKNLEHHISNDVNNLANGLSELISNTSDLGVISEVFDLLDTSLSEWNPVPQDSTIISNVTQTVNPEQSEVLPQIVQNNTVENVVEKVWQIQFNPDDNSGESPKAYVDIGNSDNSGGTALSTGSNQAGTEDSNLLKSFSQEISKFVTNEADISKLQDSNITRSEFLDIVKNLINAEINSKHPNADLKEALMKLMNNPEFKNTISKQLMSQWQLKPEDVSKEGTVEELYKRLSEQSQRAINILEHAGKTSDETMNSAKNINDNVNFMNQLNNMAQYVQLPLKMAQENANGELYVYTKKKNLANKDGNVSALLHLDMDNLGPMDVYVAMQNNKVNTNFYLADEEVLNLIEKNIHVLNARLEKKGYNMSVQMNMKNKDEAPKTIVGELLKDKTNGAVSEGFNSRLSFDIRA